MLDVEAPDNGGDMPCLVAIDIGGTFVDAVAFNRSTGEVRFENTSTTPRQPSEGVLAAISELGVPTLVKKTKTSPWALDGGTEPEPTEVVVFPDTDRERVVGTRRVTVGTGDTARFRTAGGGGHGDPHRRDPERVCRDVQDGYVSREAARDVYGVVVDPAGRIDQVVR